MVALLPRIRTAILLLLGCAPLCALAHAQSSPNESSARPLPPARRRPPTKPLPDIATLMHDVETNERKSEAVQKDYIFHSVETEQERDKPRQYKERPPSQSPITSG